MDPITILSLVQFAINEEPAVEKALRNIFAKPEPTPADWQAEREAWKTTYKDLVPNSQLPPEG
jgi:hypothetical protein